MFYPLPQELKILKSKVDVEAEQNASSFTSTVSTEPSLMATLVFDICFWTRWRWKRRRLQWKQRYSSRHIIQGQESRRLPQELTLLWVLPAWELCLKGAKILESIHLIDTCMFNRVTRDAVNRESPRFREIRASPKHSRGSIENRT